VLAIISEKNFSQNVMNEVVSDFVLKPLRKDELITRSRRLLKYNIKTEDNSDSASEMISMLAHQWRQPLNSVSGSTANVEVDVATELFDGPSLQKHCDLVQKEIAYLSKTIDDFRFYFTPTEKQELSSISHLVESAESIISIALAQNRVTLIVNEPIIDIELLFYRSEMIQAIVNILHNALDELVERKTHSPCIWLDTSMDENDIYIKIRDNAGGIDPKIVEKIFNPYFSTKKRKNGGGLGLFAVKNVINHHDGEIKVTNAEFGAEFIIKIKK
jgi:signal transduction histidine kinase